MIALFRQRNYGLLWFAGAVSLRYLDVEGTKLGNEAREFGERLPGPVALHVGPDNALYYLSASTGELRRLQYRS